MGLFSAEHWGKERGLQWRQNAAVGIFAARNSEIFKVYIYTLTKNVLRGNIFFKVNKV